MTFRKKVRFCQKERTLSQVSLIKLYGIKGNKLGKYKRGYMKSPIETAKKRMEAFSVSLNYRMGEGDLKLLDKKTFQHLDDFKKLPEADKENIFYTFYNLIKAANLKDAQQC